jgi:hypothetical protein
MVYGYYVFPKPSVHGFPTVADPADRSCRYLVQPPTVPSVAWLWGFHRPPRGGRGRCRRACERTPLQGRRRCAAGGRPMTPYLLHIGSPPSSTKPHVNTSASTPNHTERHPSSSTSHATHPSKVSPMAPTRTTFPPHFHPLTSTTTVHSYLFDLNIEACLPTKARDQVNFVDIDGSGIFKR